MHKVNLSFFSKATKKAVVNQLFEHCGDNAPLPTNQSSYRQFHSTETAHLNVYNDIFLSMDLHEVTLLVLLDLSAAFVTIDHAILTATLESEFGVTGNALKCIKFFLSHRKQHTEIKQEYSTNSMLSCGVPQGRRLGPVLFLLYVSQLFQIINKHLPSSHGYADDKQLYLSFSPDSPVAEDQAIQIISNCIDEFRAWLVSRKLMFNDTKTEFLIIGTRQQLAQVTIDSIGVGDAEKNLAQNVRNLGFWFDNHMSMKIHVSMVCSKAFRGFYNIRYTRKFLSIEPLRRLCMHL